MAAQHNCRKRSVRLPKRRAAPPAVMVSVVPSDAVSVLGVGEVEARSRVLLHKEKFKMCQTKSSPLVLGPRNWDDYIQGRLTGIRVSLGLRLSWPVKPEISGGCGHDDHK